MNVTVHLFNTADDAGPRAQLLFIHGKLIRDRRRYVVIQFLSGRRVKVPWTSIRYLEERA